LACAHGIEYSGLSNAGPVREDNQDTIRVSGEGTSPDTGLLFVLADGMGGYEYGKIASEIAVDTFFNTYYANARPGSTPQVPQVLKKGIEAANLAVCHQSDSLGAHRMGTTLTAAVADVRQV